MAAFTNGVYKKPNNRGEKYLRISAGPLRGEYVHRLIAMAMLGRELRPGEEVDHKDTDSLNPHPKNIRVFTAVGHGRVTANAQQVPEDVQVILDGEQWWKEHHDGSSRTR